MKMNPSKDNRIVRGFILGLEGVGFFVFGGERGGICVQFYKIELVHPV
jgi:hypothetical protein